MNNKQHETPTAQEILEKLWDQAAEEAYCKLGRPSEALAYARLRDASIASAISMLNGKENQ